MRLLPEFQLSTAAATERRLTAIASILPEISEVLLALQSQDLAIRTKSNDKDLVTRADLESETRLRAFIERQFPGDQILGEEGGGSISGSGFTWVIDPVDGTINYAHGLPLFAVSIGLTCDGVIEGGIVHMPALGTTYRAVRGQGAFQDGKPVRVSSAAEPSRALVVTGFPYDRAGRIELLVDGVRQVLLNCRGIRRTGSAAIDLCWLAAGRFDAHYEVNLSPWDTCAGELMVREAGGRVTTYSGAEHVLSDKSLLATNGHLHEDMLRILEGQNDLLRNQTA